MTYDNPDRSGLPEPALQQMGTRVRYVEALRARRALIVPPHMTPEDYAYGDLTRAQLRDIQQAARPPEEDRMNPAEIEIARKLIHDPRWQGPKLRVVPRLDLFEPDAAEGTISGLDNY